MYFKNRADAGRQLAQKLKRYSTDSVVVVALSEGGVIIGAQIAMEIHANLLWMLTENINLPGEPDAVAAMSSVGTFTYNNLLSTGQIEEYVNEFHGFIDQQRLEKMHRLNVLVGQEGEIHKEYLRHHTVILVSDGFVNGFSLDIAADYLKSIVLNKLVVATPLASVPAVDRMHLVGDDICCLSVVENYINTNHYYEDDTIPPTRDLFRVIKNISLHWRRTDSTKAAR